MLINHCESFIVKIQNQYHRRLEIPTKSIWLNVLHNMNSCSCMICINIISIYSGRHTIKTKIPRNTSTQKIDKFMFHFFMAFFSTKMSRRCQPILTPFLYHISVYSWRFLPKDFSAFFCQGI